MKKQKMMVKEDDQDSSLSLTTREMNELKWMSSSGNGDELKKEEEQVEVNLKNMIDDLPEKLNPVFSCKSSSSSKKKNIDNGGDQTSSSLTNETTEETCSREEFLERVCKEISISFFNEFGLISHQINSYNDFIENGIQKVFDSFDEVNVEPTYDDPLKKLEDQINISISFGKVRLERPMFWTGERDANEEKEYLKMLPRHARLQHMTYSAPMKVEVNVQVYTKKIIESYGFYCGEETAFEKEVISEDKREIVIGQMPVMVNSQLCWMSDQEKLDCDFDHGGYFLIKGAEKVFIAQEQTCLKRLWVSDRPNWAVSYRSEVKKNRRVYIKLVKAPIGEDEYVHGGLFLTVHFMSSEIPIWVLFFALGVSSDRDIIEMIHSDTTDARVVDIFLATIHNADRMCRTFRKGQEALLYMDESIKSSKFPPSESIKDIIDIYLFPNLCGLKQKAAFLGYMVKCLLLSYTGKRKCEIKDDFRNKRLELAGELLERELLIHIKHARRVMVRAIQRDLNKDRNIQPIERYLDASIITNGLCRAFSTGLWSHPFNTVRISGVVATLRQTNPLQMMSHLRKTRQQVSFVGRVGDVRFPHPSHRGILCFLSTSDGENCGLVKNMAVTGLVSTNLRQPLMDILLACGLQKLEDEASWSGKTKIFVNGDWVGVCDDSLRFVVDIRSKRRNREIPSQVEIKHDWRQGEVRIFSDSGRILRPLVVVENLKKIKTIEGVYNFNSLLDEGVVELVGVEEGEDYLTAVGIKYLFQEDNGQPKITYSHCELDPSFLLGLSCGIIPFANHNHAKRVLYESEKHSQQAIGFSTSNPNIKLDTLSHGLYYPQRPLFRTMISDCLGKPAYALCHNGVVPKPELFNGQNAIVAVNVHFGYNQEDSLVMNRASLERGMFRTEHIRIYKAEVDNMELSESKNLKQKNRLNFGKAIHHISDKVGDDGFPFIGDSLKSGDIIIGRVDDSGRDHSIKLKHTEEGNVQKVVLTSNDEGKNFAAVSLRQVRSPIIGDKFASMHGQKGVIGLLESQENFPFTQSGLVPDIVINPHAFPTRQTIGQLLEAALGKGIACGGSIRYATPFSTPSIEAITDQLHRAGYSRWGSERVYHGHNGKMMKTLIFMGPTFYQRLIHMAEDKVKFRNIGPVNSLTRQPVEDRKRFGGVKFGEMERDCLLVHGAAANLHERLFVLSDFSHMNVCQKCKVVSNTMRQLVSRVGQVRGPYCTFCESSKDIVKVNVPHGVNLLTMELFSMGICVQFETEKC